ncbi:MAG: hypothetical protein F6K54_30420 [Okeania sp. SIO3B5]|uniref:hypothetical protein n=1 Tax=Okeania sp. SIO3B5 TaxID=2607811 RepID=UPI0013FE97B0|nr:hypothetical protein [Okeania sp. SIO3B5]NEO57011.1 hypothetical protein [Okeania sp. SIO3B5]
MKQKKSYFRSINWQKYLPSIALISLILSIFLVANYHRLILDYIPFNGAFQTYNPIRRILLGEKLGRDFNPYLGLGPTYLSTFLTFLFGSNFSASQMSIYVLTLSVHFWDLGILFFCYGFTILRSLLASSLMVIILSFFLEKFPLVNEIVGPGTSNLSVRSFLPFLTSFLLLILGNFLPKSRFTYVGIGYLIGLQPLWSNDYGIPSAFNLSLLTILYLFTQDKTKIFSKIISIILSTILAFYLGGMLLTQGHLFQWLESNFKGVAGDQLWYYLWFKNYNKIFAIQDFFQHPLLIGFSGIYISSIFIIIIKGYFQTYRLKYLILIYISLTVYMAGLLSSIGGTLSVRYFLLSVIVSFFTIPLAIYLCARRFRFRVRFSPIVNLNPQKMMPFLLLIYLILPLIHFLGYYTFHTLPSAEKGYIKVDELGGWLSPKWQASVKIAHDLKEQLQNTPAQQKMLSTYTTGIDTIIGAINPTQIDYIIHALGEKARKQYLTKWQEFQPEYITTLREDAYSWETWSRRANWWFYREFMPNYKLVEATFYNLIWQRLDKKTYTQYPTVNCQIYPQQNDRVELVINTSPNNNIQPRIYYVDLTLNYDLTVQPTLIPLIGKRGLVNIIERKTASKKEIGQKGNYSYGLPKGNYSYGLPSSHSNWHIPLEHRIGTESILEMKAYPEKRAKLTVKSCKAQILKPIDSSSLIRQIIPENFNDQNWKNGIFLNSKTGQENRVMMNNDRILTELYPQMNLEFAGSGNRQIMKIKDNQIWVSGSPLNPETDGYPHAIRVKLR